MRQVPHTDSPPIGIAGDGRVARHFIHYFTQLGIHVRTWSRRGGPVSPLEAFSGCGTILLLLRDDAIADFVHAWPALRASRLVHCSGSLRTPVAESAHPLMMFAEQLYDLDLYRRIPFIVDAGGTPFHQLLPGLPNPSFAIPPEEKAYYHALCVMAGNFSTLLWARLFDQFEARLAIPASAALPYMEQIAANLHSDGGRALTGPLVRGDTGTIAANLRALEGDPFHAVYAAFARAYAERD
jgi:predicted short-subunit dehydrogenase-like oxidoreductase (DUF2520 family)